jgi:hypothetical protein
MLSAVGRSRTPFAFVVACIADREAVGEVQYFTAASAFFGEVSLTQRVFDIGIEPCSGFQCPWDILKKIGELEA